MSYTPTEWKSGDVITSAKLNKMENGIASSGINKLTTVYRPNDTVVEQVETLTMISAYYDLYYNETLLTYDTFDALLNSLPVACEFNPVNVVMGDVVLKDNITVMDLFLSRNVTPLGTFAEISLLNSSGSVTVPDSADIKCIQITDEKGDYPVLVVEYETGSL